MTPAAATTFTPSPEEADRLLALYHDPTLTLSDLAREAGTSIAALQAWLSTPEIAARLDTLEDASARRVRYLAGEHLPAAIGVLTSILREHLHAQQQGSLADDPDTRRRQHDTATRAASLLSRLARWTPGPSRVRTPATTPTTQSPSPRAGTRPTRTSDADLDLALLERLLDTAAAATRHDPAHIRAEAPPADPNTDDGAHPDPDPSARGDTDTPADSDHILEPETVAALERLSTIPDDAPPDEVNRLIATVLNSPRLPALLRSAPLREAG